MRRNYLIVLIIVLVVSFGILSLDNFCTFSISSNKEAYNAGEAVEINCTITNPLPIPIYYRGHKTIYTEMSYQNDSKIERTYPPNSETWAQRAAKEARAASGAIVDAGIIRPGGEKVAKTVVYTPMVEGEVIVGVDYQGVSRTYSSNMSLVIDKYSPMGVSVNSPGITLFLEDSKDVDNPTILIRVRNDNPYPVRFPVFYSLDESIGSGHVVVYIEWAVPYFEAPAYSTVTIYDTDLFASPTRTPISFTLYGVTLSYPLEN